MQGQLSVSVPVSGEIIGDVLHSQAIAFPLTLALFDPNQCSNRAGFEYFLGHRL
jgi:hypothetical protein